jgi:predicted esterase
MRTVAVSLLLVLPCLLLFAEARQLKVLCLHGFASSASIFNMQLSHLQSAVSSFADLTFTDGFYPLDSTGSRRRPRFSWWRRQTSGDNLVEYAGMQCSLTALARLETEVNQKPFDVIIGHSQGAAMAIAIALINARAEEGIEPPLALPSMPKALVLYSGFPPQDASLEKAYSVVEKQGGLNISSHWIIGERDKVVLPEYSRTAMGLFQKPSSFIHGGGHDPPRCESSTEYLVQVLSDLSRKQSF